MLKPKRVIITEDLSFKHWPLIIFNPFSLALLVTPFPPLSDMRLPLLHFLTINILHILTSHFLQLRFHASSVKSLPWEHSHLSYYPPSFGHTALEKGFSWLSPPIHFSRPAHRGVPTHLTFTSHLTSTMPRVTENVLCTYPEHHLTFPPLAILVPPLPFIFSSSCSSEKTEVIRWERLPTAT